MESIPNCYQRERCMLAAACGTMCRFHQLHDEAAEQQDRQRHLVARSVASHVPLCHALAFCASSRTEVHSMKHSLLTTYRIGWKDGCDAARANCFTKAHA